MTEKLGFDQLAWQRRAVDLDETAAGAGPFVNGQRAYPFTGPRLAYKQNRVGLLDNRQPQKLTRFLYGRGIAGDPIGKPRELFLFRYADDRLVEFDTEATGGCFKLI